MIAKCPLCNSSKTSFLLKSNNRHGRHLINPTQSFILNRCNKCGTVFIQKITIDRNYYKKYYSDDYYDQVKAKGLVNMGLNILTSFSMSLKERMILKNYSFKKDGISILDLGCGDGTFLSKLSDKFNKFGIELSSEGYAITKKKGIKVIYADFFDHKFKSQKFDIITMWHVFEHINNPQKLVKKVNSILNKNGLFIIAVPNADSLGFKIGKKFWFHLDSPRHLFIPNTYALKSVMKKNKFKMIKNTYEFYDSPLDLFWSIRFSVFRYIIYPLYPLFKYFSKETVTIVFRKK